MKPSFASLFAVFGLLLTSSLWGQMITVPEGWGTFELPMTPEREAAFMLKLEGGQASFSENPPPPPGAMMAGSTLLSLGAPDDAPPEIVALANGLEHDPMRIFNWVRRNIRYAPYAGCVKGALLTLLERSGNDFDQCTLLAALLRQGGVTVRYHLGGFYLNDTLAANYWQTHVQNVTNNKIFAELGIPTVNNFNTRYVLRLYVKATLPGVGEVSMDPAFRTYQGRNAMTMAQLIEACVISRDDLKNQAEGSNPPPPDSHVLWQYRQLNSAAFGSYLNSRANALISHLKDNHPNQYGDFLFAGYEQTSNDITTWAEAFPHTPGVYYPDYINGVESLPADACAELDLELFSRPLDAVPANRVSYKTITLSLPSLKGRRLDLRFENSAAILSLDDTVIETETMPAGVGNYFGIKPMMRHQLTGWSQGMSAPTIYTRGATYALAYAFQASSHWIEHRRKKLASYRALPTTDTTRDHKLKAESLFITGLNWMHQTELAMANATPMLGGRWIFQHRFGRVADEFAVQGGYYVDIPLQQMKSSAHTSAWTPAVRKTSFLSINYMQSALEHGVVEQVLDPDSAAASIAGGAGVSTIKACASARTKADTNYDYLFALDKALWPSLLAGQASWANSVKYRQPDLDLMAAAFKEDQDSHSDPAVPDVDTTLFLPQDGKLGIESWEGSGYMVLRETPSNGGLNIVMGISGGLHGGFTTVITPIPTRSIQIQGANGTYTIQPPVLPWSLSFEPIDLATGQYYLSATDIVLGDGKLPRGATFTRSYHGNKVSEDAVGLGYGWDHSLNIQVLLRSEAARAMGEGSAEEAAGFAVSMLALYQLLEGTTARVAKDWAVAAEAANWGANQFTHNAAVVTLGDRSLQFLKLPDGTFLPARGSSVVLTREGDDKHFVLRERHGNTYVFDASRKLSTVTDAWNKQATFRWAGTRLASVTDAYNRVMTFSNSGERLWRVNGGVNGTPATNQYVDFTNPSGDLLRVDRWAEGSYPSSSSYEYDTGGKHRITFLRDHQNRVIAKNIYDVDGRVSQQLSMGDTARTWDYRYAYGETVELKPAKDVNTTARDRNFYRFDSRNRQVLHIDGLGKSWRKSYDGQDHLVQELSPLTAGSNTAGMTVYDADHNVLERTDRYGRAESWSYSQDGNFHLLSHTDRRSKLTVFSDYNAEHQPLTITDAEGRVSALTYAPATSPGAGQVATVTKAGQLKITYSYADNSYGPGYGQVTGVTYPRTGTETADPVELRGYSLHGDLTRVKSPRAADLGTEIVTTFDEMRRQRTVALPGSQSGDPNVVTETIYDGNSNVWKTIAPKGSLTNAPNDFTTENTYFASGKIDTTTTPVGAVQHFYDFKDDEVKVTDPLNLSITLGYDAAGRKKTITNHLSQTVTTHFDDDGRTTRVEDPLTHGDTLSYAQHTDGETQTSLNSLSQTSSRRLDKNGNWTHFTNPRSKTWTMSYDDTGRLETLTTPESRSASKEYDDQGRLWKSFEPSGQYIEFDYDARDRVLTKTVHLADGAVEGSATSYTYDKNGNVLTVTEGTMTITRTYDRQDRVLTYTSSGPGWNYTLGYRYDAHGNLVKLIYPDNSEVTYTFDEMDRMKTVTDWAGRVTTYTWDNGGRLKRVDRPNKTARVLSYDDAGRLTRADELLPGETKGGVFPTAQYTFVSPTQPLGTLGWWKPSVGVNSITSPFWGYFTRFPSELVPAHLANRPVFKRYGPYSSGMNDFIPAATSSWHWPASIAAGQGAWFETRLSNATGGFWNNGTPIMWSTQTARSRWEYWIAGYSSTPPQPSPLQPGRLINVQAMGYDAAGRMQMRFRLPQPLPLPPPAMTAASYDGDNRFLGCTEYPAAQWAHDTDGNLTRGMLPGTMQMPQHASSLTWDARNRLTSLTNTSTTEQFNYTYDPEGHREESRRHYSFWVYPFVPPNIHYVPLPPVLISGTQTTRHAIRRRNFYSVKAAIRSGMVQWSSC